MSHDEHHDEHGEDPPYKQHFFDSMTQQGQSTLFGMWLFMAQEILFFGGLFGAYTAYRVWYQDAYIAGADTLDVVWGLVNTIVLLASSVTIVFAVKSAREGKRWHIVSWLMITLVLGFVFLGVKTIEYTGKYNHHLVPGDGRVLSMVGLEPKPFDFAYYQDWKIEDAVMGGHDNHHNAVGRPRNFVKDAWFRYHVVKDEHGKRIDKGFLAKSQLEEFRNAVKDDDDAEEKIAARKKELQAEIDYFHTKYDKAVAEYQANTAFNPAPYSPDFTGKPYSIPSHEEGKVKPVVPKGVEIYYSLYFAMSGMHALHMIIGSFLLLWIAVLAAMGTFTKEWYPHVEYFGLYWHFVDIVWIFLFPLLYLI